MTSPDLHARLQALLHRNNPDPDLAAQGQELLRSLGPAVIQAMLCDGSLTSCNLEGISWDGIDLRGARLSGSRPGDLRGRDLTGADLRGVDLHKADLTGATLRRALLARADLTAADLTDADLRQSSLRWARMRQATLTGTQLHMADLRGARMPCIPRQVFLHDDATDWPSSPPRRQQEPWPPEPGADLGGVFLWHTVLVDRDLEEVRLTDALLVDSTLRASRLRGADLRGAELRGCSLRDVDLRDADLSGTRLTGTSLRGADLRGACLAGAVLTDMRLTGVRLDGADLAGVTATGLRADAATIAALPEALRAVIAVEPPIPPPPPRPVVTCTPREWLWQALSDKDWKVQEAAAVSLAELGDAEAMLAELLKPENIARVPWKRMRRVALYCRPEWIQARVPFEHLGALLLCAQVGCETSPAERSKLLRSSYYQLAVFRTLSVPERRAIARSRRRDWSWWLKQKPSPRRKRPEPAWLDELLTTTDQKRRAWLCDRLARPWCLPLLVPRLATHPDRILPVLGRIRAPGDLGWPVVSALLDPHLASTDRKRARFAAEAAGRCGRVAEDHLPALLSLTTRTTPIRAAATRAIGRILAGPDADTTPGAR